MKAIVANVLFGGILGCLTCAGATSAQPLTELNFAAPGENLATTQPPQSRVTATNQLVDSIDRALIINGLQSLNTPGDRQYYQWLEQRRLENIEQSPQGNSRVNYTFPNAATNCWSNICDTSSSDLDSLLTKPQQAYRHQSSQANIILGFQKTFWSAENRGRYWGVTTVEQWGAKTPEQSARPQLNYLNSAPTLAAGSSALTFSGGGNQNLLKSPGLDFQSHVSPEFTNFRGGMAYHYGVAKQLTMGVGFVYENLENIWVGFTQFTYNSDVLPLKTTVSLLTQEATTDLHSHIQFKPAPNFVANYYGDYGDVEHHKLDADWGIYPGFNLIAKANSKQKSYSTGVKLALRHNNFSLTAMASLDKERNLQWKLNSQIGRFKFAHSSNPRKSSSELSNQLLDAHQLGWQCSAFIKYETSQKHKSPQDFTIWGGKINSQTKIGNNQHRWEFSMGYGISDAGSGWIGNGKIALKSDLIMKLSYQEISAAADETKIKLQLSSN
ncbi:MAG: hypothetical protein AAFQ41_02145 [Cyanobacteria bacterium J06623_7]